MSDRGGWSPAGGRRALPDAMPIQGSHGTEATRARGPDQVDTSSGGDRPWAAGHRLLSHAQPLRDPSVVRSWTIDPARAALAVHDMQNHFVRAFPAGRSPRWSSSTTSPPCANSRARSAFRSSSAPNRLRSLPTNAGLFTDIGAGNRSEPDAAAIVPALTPRPGEHLLASVRTTPFSAAISADCCDPRAASS